MLLTGAMSKMGVYGMLRWRPRRPMAWRLS
jgi:hypothetical protein